MYQNTLIHIDFSVIFLTARRLFVGLATQF